LIYKGFLLLKNLLVSHWSRRPRVFNQSSQDIEELWWDNEQLCTYLNISTRTLQSYRDNGAIEFSQYGSKIWCRYQDVQEFLERHRKR